MKKRLFILLLMLGGLQLSAQVRISSIGDPIYIKNQHVFSIVSTDYSSYTTEYIIVNITGNPLLAFVPFKIQDGWSTQSYDSQYSSNYKSGTSHSLFFRVASLKGDYCDVPAKGLPSTRAIARLVTGFGLIKNGELDETVFEQFCLIHGKVNDNLKYFK